MHEHYDKLETRDPEERERDLLGRLPDLIALALSAPGWAEQLAGVDPNAVTSRAALAKLPVLRKSDLAGAAEGSIRRSAASTSRRPARCGAC